MLSYTKPTLTCCVQPDPASVCFCLWPPAERARVFVWKCVCVCASQARTWWAVSPVPQQGHRQMEHTHIMIIMLLQHGHAKKMSCLSRCKWEWKQRLIFSFFWHSLTLKHAHKVLHMYFPFTPSMGHFSRAQMDTWVTGGAADQSSTTAWCVALKAKWGWSLRMEALQWVDMGEIHRSHKSFYNSDGKY